MKENVSCIIAAYNEEGRVGVVLKTVLNNKTISEVIIVNDGSTDNTLRDIKKFSVNKKLKIIDLNNNKGKSFAIFKAIKCAKNKILLFLDADLKNLNDIHITSLINPVIENKAIVSIGLLEDSYPIFKWIGLDLFSGQRAIRKRNISRAEDLKNIEKYGLEVFMNEQIIEKGFDLKVVYLKGLCNTRKSNKHPTILDAIIKDLQMSYQIIKQQGIFGLVHQTYKMKKLKI